MKADHRYNPIIVCVPLEIHNHIYNGGKYNDTYNYFIEQDMIVISMHLDGQMVEWLDLKQLNLD